VQNDGARERSWYWDFQTTVFIVSFLQNGQTKKKLVGGENGERKGKKEQKSIRLNRHSSQHLSLTKNKKLFAIT